MQESIIGSRFSGSYRWLDRATGKIVPTHHRHALRHRRERRCCSTSAIRSAGESAEHGQARRHRRRRRRRAVHRALLRAARLRVTVVERNGAERDGCSFGNAGMIVPSHFVPLAAPGMVALGLKWMWNPALAVLHQAARFAGICSTGAASSGAPPTPRTSPRRAAAARSAPRQPRAATKSSPRDRRRLRPREAAACSMLCKTQHALDEEAHTAEHARELGMPAEVLDRRRPPRSSPACAWTSPAPCTIPHDCHLTPERLMARAAARAARRGVRVRCGTPR